MPAPAITARALVLDAERRFDAAGLVFGHGTDNARDEAVFLVFHALELPFDCPDSVLDGGLRADQVRAVEKIVDARITTRKPAAYLTGRMWFAGHEFYVDERVLVPRSPIAELINEQFEPWLDADAVERVLEIGTGSGCIATALALALPRARVDATDISPAALEIARANSARYSAATNRIQFIEADLFPRGRDRYDLIVTNPPYVPSGVVASLPPEYHHEPAIGLDAGPDGLVFVRRIVEFARDRLTENGALIVDVGEMSTVVDREIDAVSFTWIDMAFGGEGIGIAYRGDFRY
jgi:ribosomal protein L3 glutamine methyltransferase